MSWRLWVLTGPTASGKSALAIDLAEAAGAEIVSMDSMAVYRHMEIGTAKPSHQERTRVRHHLIDVVEPNEEFDTARWCAMTEALIAAARAAGRPLLVVGGTPLYLMALLKGLVATPPADPQLRAQLAARFAQDPAGLFAELAAVDPVAASRIHRNDEKRIVRALEVFQLTGRPASEQRAHFDQDGFRHDARVLCVQRSRDDLHERVRRRTKAMLEAGLLEETRAIRDRIGFSSTARLAIGYAECLRHLDVPFKDEEELRNRIRRSTHGLIRRQITWFRRIRGIDNLAPTATAAEALARLRAEPT
ncbi:MAG: tRNA (adenosine(37)-N6)-dimethylallyltransferase MiaA [Planctomycetota bacterium]